jgi:hypothetical protein
MFLQLLFADTVYITIVSNRIQHIVEISYIADTIFLIRKQSFFTNYFVVFDYFLDESPPKLNKFNLTGTCGRSK